MMNRILEPELMEEQGQAEAYAAADFSEADRLMLQAFNENFAHPAPMGLVLDLGCGPGNMSFRFAERYAGIRIVGIDGSAEMLRIANERKASNPDLTDRIQFLHGTIQQVCIPSESCSAIISNSLLHHLHHPEILWEFINRHADNGCKILIMDLLRPDTLQQAQAVVECYAANEPKVLKRDFYNSLLAALTENEIERQLLDAGLTELAVRKVSDRHVIIVGEKH